MSETDKDVYHIHTSSITFIVVSRQPRHGAPVLLVWRRREVAIHQTGFSNRIQIQFVVAGGGNGVLHVVAGIATLDADEDADDDEEEGCEEAHEEGPREGPPRYQGRGAHDWPEKGAVHDQPGQDQEP